MDILEQPVIRTERLRLRPVREGDAEHLFALFANWEVMRWLSSPPWPYTRDHAAEFIDARMRPDRNFITAVIVRDDTFIGSLGAIVKPASANQRERGYNLGYWLGEPYWGHGYMSEAARAFVTYVFAAIPDNAIYSGAFVGNEASLRIQHKLGFEHDGNATLSSNPNGKEMPHVSTVLTRQRFAALNG